MKPQFKIFAPSFSKINKPEGLLCPDAITSNGIIYSFQTNKDMHGTILLGYYNKNNSLIEVICPKQGSLKEGIDILNKWVKENE